jgi:ketosteroid isomerase-like protein
MTDTRTIAEQYLERVAAGNIDRILELFASDAELVILGSARIPWLGRRTTVAEFRQFYEQLFDLVTVNRFDVEKIVVDGDEAVILGDLHDTVNATGRSFGFPFAIRLTVHDGLIRLFHMHEDSYALHEAFAPEQRQVADTREVASAFLERRAAGDIDGMLDLFAEQVDVHSFGTPRVDWLGRYESKAEARQFFERLFAGITPEDAQVYSFIVDGPEAVILGDLQVRINATGRTYRSPFALRLTVRDGLIVRHQVFEDSYALHVAAEPENTAA